jgi:hypothetical protein
MSRTTQPVAQPMPTLTPDSLRQIINEVLAEREQANAQMAQSDQALKLDQQVRLTFKKRGFGIVQPRVDTKTFNLWAEEGLRPKEGEKSVKVKSLRLFHRTQCRPLTEAERATKTSDRLPIISPAETKGKTKDKVVSIATSSEL